MQLFLFVSAAVVIVLLGQICSQFYLPFSQKNYNSRQLSIANMRINFHASFSLDRNRLIEKNFVSEFMEAMAFSKFELNLSI